MQVDLMRNLFCLFSQQLVDVFIQQLYGIFAGKTVGQRLRKVVINRLTDHERYQAVRSDQSVSLAEG